MTAVLYTMAKAQFFDDNGDPLAFGKLYAYTAGTLTPKDTYIDQAGVSTNTNPVVLDAAGRADIWLNGSYKFILKTSADVTIWTEDNVTSFTTAVTVPDDSITNAKLAEMAANTMKVNNTASTANPVDMTIGANTFPARASTGQLAAKSITDFGLSMNAAADAPAANVLLGAGTLVTIASGNLATGSPSAVDITGISSAYRELILYVEGATNTVATRALYVSFDTGSGLGNAANCTTYTQSVATAVATVAATTVPWSLTTQTAAQVASCVVKIPTYASSAAAKMYTAMFSQAQTAGAAWNTAASIGTVSGVLVNASGVIRTGAVVGIRISWNDVSTGVFDGGTYALYGVV